MARRKQTTARLSPLQPGRQAARRRRPIAPLAAAFAVVTVVAVALTWLT